MSMVRGDEMIYLDNNATTRVDTAVVEAMLPFFTENYGNPSSGYRFGARVREAIDRAREQVAGLIGCEPGEIVFTSGGTESNNAALHSATGLDPNRRHIITTRVEHSAVLRHCEALEKRGCEVTYIGVGNDGNIDVGEIQRAIRPDTAVISAMWANNETGVLFPVSEIAELASSRGIFFHTDAVQAVGKIRINVRESAIQFLALSAHKIYGPKGVGALYVNRRARFSPSMIGGGQEEGRRAGTENVAGIVGLGKASELGIQKLAAEPKRIGAMRDRFEELLLKQISDCQVNGDRANRLPNTSSLSFAGIESEGALMLLDRAGICCSAGSACRSGSREASHVLRAMNVSDEKLKGSLRFSFGQFNSEPEVDFAASKTVDVIAKLRGLNALGRADFTATV